MARISSKPLASEADISANDYLLGNDVNDGSIATKRFSLEDIKEFVLDGTEQDVVRNVPPGNLIVVDPNSADLNDPELTRAPLQVSYTPVIGEIPLVVNGEIGGPRASYRIDQNGQSTLTFVNYNLEYYLPGFVGTTITFNTVLSGTETTYTATIDNYIPYNPATSIEGDGDVLDVFNISTTSVEENPLPIEAGNDMLNLTVTAANASGNFGILSNLEMSSLVITGGLELTGDLDIGTPDDRSEVNVHGFLNFDEGQEGIRFGDAEGPNVTLTSDGAGNLIFDGLHGDDTDGDGAGIVTFNDPVRLQAGVDVDEITFADGDSITVINADGITLTEGGVDRVLQTITANDPAGTGIAQGELTSIEINGDTWRLPAFDASAVVEALPGLDESLSGPTENITTGTFFFGSQQGVNIVLQSDNSRLLQTVDITIPEGATSFDLDDFAGDEALFETFRTGQGTDEQIYFVEDGDAFTETDFAPDHRFEPEYPFNIYMIMAYNETTNVATFGLIGTGAVTISSSTFNIASDTIVTANLPDEDDATFDFVTIGGDNVLSRTNLDIIGNANGADFVDDMGTTVPLSSLEFTGDHNVVNTGGNVVVDISGRYVAPVAGGVLTGSAATQLFTLNILDTTTVDTPTLTLPVAQAFGDSVKVVNVSAFTETGVDATSSTWNVAPGGGQRIMKQTGPLVLDDQTASFEMVWSGSDDIGWTIIGID